MVQAYEYTLREGREKTHYYADCSVAGAGAYFGRLVPGQLEGASGRPEHQWEVSRCLPLRFVRLLASLTGWRERPGTNRITNALITVITVTDIAITRTRL